MTIIYRTKARNSATFFVILLENLGNGLKKFELAEQDTIKYYYLQRQPLLYTSTILSLTCHLRRASTHPHIYTIGSCQPKPLTGALTPLHSCMSAQHHHTPRILDGKV